MNRIITVLLVTVAALLALGLATLASITMAKAGGASLIHPFLLKQAVACVMGFLALGVAAALDYRRLERWVGPICLGTLLLLVLVLTPLGTSSKGAQRWLWGVQPSEFAKLALILTLAWFGARFMHRLRTFTGGVLGMGGVALPFLVLVVVEPDKGTTMLLAAVTALLMLVAGVRWLHVLVPVVVGAALFGVIIANSGYARARVEAFWKPADSNKDLSLQVDRALDAFGAGGLHGTGFGIGTYKGRIPEVHTDFILPAVGEELGLLFTLGVVAAFLVLLVCGALIAHHAKDSFGMLVAAGITFTIAIQALVNLGVVTYLLPNKGMPLPFLSRGGTGTVVLLTMIGLLISIARRAEVLAPSSVPRSVSNPFGEPDTELPR
jgi:cell division protein FtsW